MSVNHPPPENGKCQLCGNPHTLTATGRLTPLAARTYTRLDTEQIYVRWICEDCVALFNSTNWPKTRAALKELRKGGVVGPRTVGRHWR